MLSSPDSASVLIYNYKGLVNLVLSSYGFRLRVRLLVITTDMIITVQPWSIKLPVNKIHGRLMVGEGGSGGGIRACCYSAAETALEGDQLGPVIQVCSLMKERSLIQRGKRRRILNSLRTDQSLGQS